MLLLLRLSNRPLNAQQQCKDKDMLPLLAGDTRFYTEFIAAERILLVKSALQETVVSGAFGEWADKQSYKAEAARVKALILNEEWWAIIVLMVALFKPIVDLLRLVDSDLPTMGKVSQELGHYMQQF